MSLVGRLRLDEVVGSLPELGPTVPDGGYSWIILIGVLFIQITVPSVLSMYGTVLGYLAWNKVPNFDLWNEKITLTPILFVAFWSLADPWTKTITDLASIPRLVGIIGVILLSTGVVASGYLATGGVGAYLASLSAGAVMGVGTSFVIVQSEVMLRRHFRVKLPLALTLKNIAASFGFTFVPVLTHFLLEEAGVKSGLLLMTIVFIPAALGALVLHSPTPPPASPYRLLLPTNEDNDLGIRMSPDITGEAGRQNNGVDNLGYIDNADKRERNSPPVLFNEMNSIYAYEEPEEDVELFVSPAARFDSRWKQEFHAIRYFRFWAAVITWIGVKTYMLFFWILLPTLFLSQSSHIHLSNWVTLLVTVGIGTFVSSIGCCWSITTTARNRRIYFGSACWLGSIILIGLTYADTYYWFLVCSLLGGISVNSLLTCQDLTLCEVLGNQFLQYSRKLFFSFVGLGVLIFCFLHSEKVCLRAIAFLEFFGGCYWILPPLWRIIKTRRFREN